MTKTIKAGNCFSAQRLSETLKNLSDVCQLAVFLSADPLIPNMKLNAKFVVGAVSNRD